MENKINKSYYLLSLFILALLLPLAGSAQGLISAESKDWLLEQYLFPISTFLPSGQATSLLGSECQQYKIYDGEYAACQPCADEEQYTTNHNCLPTSEMTADILLTEDKKAISTKQVAGFSYRFAVKDEGNYTFGLNVANDADNFYTLTSQQLDYIFQTPTAPDNRSYIIDNSGNLQVLEYSANNEIPENRKYELFRSLIFSVYVDGETAADQKGYIIVKNEGTKVQLGSVLIGNLKPGEHTVYLHFLTDYYFDFSAGELPAVYDNFKNADLNTVADKKLDVNPIISTVFLDTTSPTVDVVGIRIYTNTNHKDIKSWYSENVVNASANALPIKVDGYEAIRDERTIYVNAANLDLNRGNLFTNIYVLAYNQNAAPQSVEIYNQMVTNWIFNKNVMAGKNTEEAELEKDKLRRDTVRFSDLFRLNSLLENYKSSHGNKCPTLQAGTFVPGHTISTWPSWQSTKDGLAQQLGVTSLPIDPLNIMSTQFRGQYNCQSADPNESSKCENICRRDKDSKALTGCPKNEQCYNYFCSFCPPGTDPSTCWDDINLQFYNPATYQGCQVPGTGEYISYEGAYRLNASDCQAGENSNSHDAYVNDGAFVYQYVVRDNGANCSFVNRFEYTSSDICPSGFCYFDNNDGDATNDCYQPGNCLAKCEGAECLLPQFKNLTCYLGGWRYSCGDGFLQTKCGEACDPNMPMDTGTSWCDLRFTDQDWYAENKITSTCDDKCSFGVKDFTIADCGGFCGDKVVEEQYGETCDEGPLPAPLKIGLGGSLATLQYMCSGISSDVKLSKTGTQCTSYTDDWFLNELNACSALPVYDAEIPSRVSKQDANLLSLGGFRASYDFSVLKDGAYNLQLVTANYGDDINSLSKAQIDYLIQSNADKFWYLRRYCVNDPEVMCTIDDHCGTGTCGPLVLNVPEYSRVAVTDEKIYNTIRSFIYAVYLAEGEQTQDQAQFKGFVIIPATNTNNPQKGSLSLGVLKANNNYKAYLHFVSDYFYVPDVAGNDPLASVAKGAPDETALDINPVLYSVDLAAAEASVGNCKTYGGFCGDGLVQLEYGEQCDSKNYLQPTPASTNNLVQNSNFESGFTPWEKEGGEVSLDQFNSFDGRYGLAVKFNPDLAVNIKQYNNILANKDYAVSLRLKGNVGQISLETGDKNVDSWFANSSANILEDVSAAQIGDWKLYSLVGNYNFTQSSYKFKIKFTKGADAVVYVDAIKIIPIDASSRPQYQCSTDTATGKRCQYKGGFCGDGIVQGNFGESCDDRIGLSCSSDQECGAKGKCLGAPSGFCQSDSCNDTCKSTQCGDGIIQKPNSGGVNEICDWGNDPYCYYDCQNILMGGDCTSDIYEGTCNPQDDPSCRPCASGLSCTIRNFGDVQAKCLGVRGTPGCRRDADCILGYYCDTNRSKCMEEVSTYARYHPEGATSLTLPSPAPADTSYDINISSCPSLRQTIGSQDTDYLIDDCTYITWLAYDNITRIDGNWNYLDSKNVGCVGETRLPTITELYSLVAQTQQEFLYTDNEKLNLCPVNCIYDNLSTNLCEICLPPDNSAGNYLYWSSTCTEKVTEDNSTTCKKALAINFKYGSIEEYDTSNKFKVRCLKDTKCGNGIVEEGETCEFYQEAGTGRFIEKNISSQCTAFGYDGGFLHCNPETCNYQFDNCYLFSQPGQSCKNVCQARKGLNCNSVGLNVDKYADLFDPSDNLWKIANDRKLMNINAASQCILQDIPVSEACAYPYIPSNRSCVDTLTGKTAPINSEYSYCNCQE